MSSSSYAKFLLKSEIFLKVCCYLEKKAFLALALAQSILTQL